MIAVTHHTTSGPARRGPLATGLAVAGLLWAGTAQAETQMVRGEQLVLTDTLSQDVTISTDASLNGQIRLSMDGSLSCLSTVSGSTTAISTSGCDDDGGTLRIEVPPSSGVIATVASDGNLRVGDLHAPLTVTLNGSGDLTAGRSGALTLAIHGSGDAVSDQVDGPATLDMTGTGDARLRRVYGPLTSQQRGSGDLVVGTIQSSAVTMEASASGDAIIGGGRIGLLVARFSGSADLSVAAPIENAELIAAGGSDIKLGSVSGHVTKVASGGSDIVIGGAGLTETILSHSTRKLAGDSHDGGNTGGPSGVHIVMSTAGLILAGIIGWRILRRRRGPVIKAPPSPAVHALAETMARLDQRLSQLETYVTTREFDLARKFRELEK